MKPTYLLCVTAVCGSSLSAFAYDVNKDLINKGPAAHDIAVILSGSETVTNHYDGYSNGRFNSFSHGPDGANTKMHWQAFNDSGGGGDGNGMIDTGQLIHVGWSTSDHSSNVLDMYWTDEQGNRIPGSIVYNSTSGWTYETSTQTVSLDFENLFDSPMVVFDLQFAVLPEPLPLAELNNQSDLLQQTLRPVPGGEQFILEPGAAVTLFIDQPIPPDATVVLRYVVDMPESDAFALDFVQFSVSEAGSCPEDLDGDGVVGQSDLGILLSDYGCVGADCIADIDGDGDTDQGDLGALLAVYGRDCVN